MAWEPAVQPAAHYYPTGRPIPIQQGPCLNLDFLNYTEGTRADLTVFVSSSDKSFTFRDLDHDLIAQSCPLLALSFENGHRGLHHSIEATSVELIAHFLRFLHTGDYMTFDGSNQEEPCSLLLHAELCRLGDLYEIDTLMVQAHLNVIRKTELACSSSQAPEDLVSAIRFIYEQLSGHRDLVDTVLHYCISCFVQHGLGRSEGFKLLVYELRQFHTDLCRTNYHRGFEDEGEWIVAQPDRNLNKG